PFGHIALGRRRIRLLAKGRHAPRRGSGSRGIARLDVSVARLGTRGTEPDRDDGALVPCEPRGGLQVAPEALRGLDPMIRGEYGHHRVRTLPTKPPGRERDRG